MTEEIVFYHNPQSRSQMANWIISKIGGVLRLFFTSHDSNIPTKPLIFHRRSVTSAAMAGEISKIVWILTKLVIKAVRLKALRRRVVNLINQSNFMLARYDIRLFFEDPRRLEEDSKAAELCPTT